MAIYKSGQGFEIQLSKSGTTRLGVQHTDHSAMLPTIIIITKEFLSFKISRR